MSHSKSILGLIAWIILCFTAASLGAFFPPSDWYSLLKKPAWNPPSWVFAPVWTTLYTLMAISAWLVWRKGGFALQRRPLTHFLIQLLFNAAWTPLFFGLHLPGIALVEILFLWLAILITLVTFRPISPTASWLLLPYLAWVTFAAVLNGTLWWLNR